MEYRNVSILARCFGKVGTDNRKMKEL